MNRLAEWLNKFVDWITGPIFGLVIAAFLLWKAGALVGRTVRTMFRAIKDPHWTLPDITDVGAFVGSPLLFIASILVFLLGVWLARTSYRRLINLTAARLSKARDADKLKDQFGNLASVSAEGSMTAGAVLIGGTLVFLGMRFWVQRDELTMSDYGAVLIVGVLLFVGGPAAAHYLHRRVIRTDIRTDVRERLKVVLARAEAQGSPAAESELLALKEEVRKIADLLR